MKRFIKLSLLSLVVASNLMLFQNCAPFESIGSLSDSQTQLSSNEESAQLSAKCQKITLDEIGNSPLRRMLKFEIENVYLQLFGRQFFEEQNLIEVFDILNDEATEDSIIGYEELLSIPAALGVADTVVDRAVAEKMKNVEGAMGCTGSEPACLAWFSNFSKRAMKMKSSPEQQAELEKFYRDNGLALAMKRVLLSPEFLTHIEWAAEDSNKRARLSSMEVAHRLSFGLTGGLPDSILIEAAEQGGLVSLEGLRQQGRRLLATEMGRRHLNENIKRWLGLDRVPDPSSSVSRYYGLEGVGYGQEAKAELGKFLDYILFEKVGSFKDLLLDKSTFPFTERLGINTNLGVGDKRQIFKDFRGGILFRPASLVSSLDYSDPIQRGVYFRKRILCDNIPSPTDAILESRDEEINSFSHEEFSSRTIVTEVTKGVCMGCHSLINPIGFVLEGIDPFGKPRPVERIFDSEGKIIAEHKVDTVVDNLNLEPGGKAQPAQSPEDLAGYLSESSKAMLCLSQTLVETSRQKAAGEYETCLSEKLSIELKKNKSVNEVVLDSIVSEDIFWIKKQ